MAIPRNETADFSVRNEGTIFILYAHTDAAQEWVSEHLPADRTTWGCNGTVVEHRYILDIIDGIRADGMEVMFGACPDIASLPGAPKGVWPSAKIWIN